MSKLGDIFGTDPADNAGGPYTARVVRSSGAGVFVVAIGDDTRTPIGPCRGARRPAVSGGNLTWQPLPVGVLVLLVETDEGPWVAGWEDA